MINNLQITIKTYADLECVRRRVCLVPTSPADPKHWVYLAEGEKDTRNLAKAGFVATTNPGGAGKWRKEFSEVLRGRKVAVLPDNDKAGREHAIQVATSLQGIAKLVKIVDLPGLPQHGDVSDWFAKGGTPQKLRTLVRETPIFAPSAGKTTLLTHLSAAVVRGEEFLGSQTIQSPVVYLTEQNWGSFREALRRAGLLDCQDFAFLLWADAIGQPWERVAAEAVEECRRRGARLLVVDTIAPFAGLMGSTENDSGNALAAMKPLQMAASIGISPVMVQHERKGGGEIVESGRGSTAFAGAVDILLSLSRPKGRGQLSVRELHGISRFDETPSSMLIELTDEGYVSHGEVRPIAQEKARKAILDALPKSKQDAITLPELMAICEISRTTAQKAADTLVREGLIHKNGEGKRSYPFRFWASITVDEM
jgi:hypothetical protein